MRRRFLVVCLLAATACDDRASSELQQVETACAVETVGRMTWIPGGSFVMGEAARYPEEGPARVMNVDGFWIGVHEVTNAEFAAFAEATGYQTVAERDPPAMAGAPPDMLKPGSAVFTLPTPDDPRWWRWVVGANWRHPSGPSDTAMAPNLPVVQIAYEDAEAYARWAGKALPTEAQWEYAARAGEPSLPEPLDDEGVPQANYYQGIFPVMDMGTDGFKGPAPVGCFPPNRLGLHDMIGNVWEWTGDPASGNGATGVIKGGSYLCAANYCARYRPAARQFQERSLGTDHIGFRLVDNDTPPPPGAQNMR